MPRKYSVFKLERYQNILLLCENSQAELANTHIYFYCIFIYNIDIDTHTHIEREGEFVVCVIGT